MNVKKLVLIMSVCIVLVIGFVALIVNLNKEPLKIVATNITKELGYDIAKDYYGFSDKDENKYFDIENINDAYNSLIEGKNNIILSVMPPEESLKKLEKANVEIETYAISGDALVFINNKINPVTNIKSEDIRRIYSREYEAWDKVGGENSEIIAYQSESNGDLYNVLVKFMGDYALKTPKIRLRDETFSGVINAVTKYLDTRKRALGYVRYNELINNDVNDDIRILTLDEVFPNDTTISKGEYPGSFDICLIARKVDNSQVKKLVEYIKSNKGQTVIRENGYVLKVQ